MSKDIEAKARTVANARAHVDEALAALRHRADTVDYERLSAARSALVRAQRDLGLARGDEVAVPLRWDPSWDTGAPLPHVVSSGYRVFLTYYVRVPDPLWDGTYVNVVDPASDEPAPIAIVEFRGCYSHRLGGPNDEVLHGHPLAERGLDGYGAYRVESSRWIAEHQRTNSVHARYDASQWERRNHCFLVFHDEVFECIAEGFEVEVRRDAFRSIWMELAERVLE